MCWLYISQLHPPSRWSFLHWAAEEHRKGTPAGLLSCSKRTMYHTLQLICQDVFWPAANSSFRCPSDHSGGDQVVCGVHQNAAHCLRGVWSLPETALPAALQRPHQVRAHSMACMLSLTQTDDYWWGDLIKCKDTLFTFFTFGLVPSSPLRPSRRQFPRVMPLSKPGE